MFNLLHFILILLVVSQIFANEIDDIAEVLENSEIDSYETSSHHVYLDHGKMTQEVIDALSKCTSIKELHFNSVVTPKDLDYSPLKKLDNIEYLYLYDIDLKTKNKQNYTYERIINLFKNVQYLKLEAERRLLNEELKAISDLSNLEELLIQDSELDESKLDDFKNLTNLKNLVLKNEKLTKFPKFILSLTKLESLVLSFNEITTIPKELGNLKKLQHIDLLENNISSELPESLNSLENLDYINVSGNEKLKGKTLTNPSLNSCYYPENDLLCVAKRDIECFSHSRIKLQDCENFDLKISTNGKCNKNDGKCPFDQCCSKDGKCGTGSKYCGQGCQSEFGICHESKISTNGRCGEDYGICPDNKCCSKWGYCGTSDKHCGGGCQSEFGKCKPASSRISTNGRCGKDDGICPDGECCSKWGYCGTSEKHCGKGCQSEFGKCK